MTQKKKLKTQDKKLNPWLWLLVPGWVILLTLLLKVRSVQYAIQPPFNDIKYILPAVFVPSALAALILGYLTLRHWRLSAWLSALVAVLTAMFVVAASTALFFIVVW